MSVYALKQPRPGGGEWIQEHDSLEAALQFQSHSGGILVRREGHTWAAWTVVGRGQHRRSAQRCRIGCAV